MAEPARKLAEDAIAAADEGRGIADSKMMSLLEKDRQRAWDDCRAALKKTIENPTSARARQEYVRASTRLDNARIREQRAKRGQQ